MSSFPGLWVYANSKCIEHDSCFMPKFSHCSTKYEFESPTQPASSEVWAHFRAQPLPTWGTLGKTNSSFCPWSCTVNPFSLIVWIWFCFIMAKVLRLSANAICLQSGDVRDLPKRTLQSAEITAGADGRQVHAAGRDTLVLLLRNLTFSPWIPSQHLSEGFCLYKVGQVQALDHPLSLMHSKPRNKALLKAQPC